MFGGSQGGLISAMAAADRKDDVKGLILLYPAFCIADNWNSRFKREDDIPSKLELWGMELGNTFFRTLRGFDLHTYISRFERPVLIMHGDRDEVVHFPIVNRRRRNMRSKIGGVCRGDTWIYR